ncbi:LITAF-like zinc ribbon domain [Popillia japonica]|uniref:LITAF-like zinc ribbon domain n=1 Tax=Popillia japonica TaxID=7064 RepID=A0AAW1IZ37_POPJA
MNTELERCDPPPYSKLQNEQVDFDLVVPTTSVQPTAPQQLHPLVNNVVVGASPMLQASCNFGPKKQVANCPYCHVQSTTKVKSKALTKAHCWACIFFFIGFWPCICCPYCCCDCSRKLHYCGNCKAFLGTYTP